MTAALAEIIGLRHVFPAHAARQRMSRSI